MSSINSPRSRVWGAAAAFSTTLVLGAVAPVAAQAAPQSVRPASSTIATPQPFSTADQNNTGANTTSPTNPYRSTTDGSPSANGSDTGHAIGRPCAGCVGQADNKYPAGQAPGGSDHNKGYECDANQGIGQGNPAHSGCTVNSTGTGTTGTGTTGTGTTGTGTTGTGTTGTGTTGTGTTGTGTTGTTTTGTGTTGTTTVLGAEGSKSTAPTSTGPTSTGPNSSGPVASLPTSVLAAEGTNPTPTPAVTTSTGAPAGTSGTQVLAASGSAPATAVAATSGTLPFTGSSTQALVELAGAALIVGFGSLAASRKRSAVRS